MTVFRSVRFNIFLGALITLASAVGTLLPQLTDAPEKVDLYQRAHPYFFKAFDALSLFDLYHSWWFMGMLGLMAFDIVLCKLISRPPDRGLIALPPELTRESQMERLAQKESALKLKPLQAGFSTGLDPAEAASRAKGFLAERGYFPSEELAAPQGETFVATRHRLQGWGSYVSHIALVVILAGALVKGVYGFVEMVPVLEGGSRAVSNRPSWEVYVDKFTIKYYDNTMSPKLFSSEIRVEKNGVELGRKTIKVNEPLDIGGVRFYQASWGAGGMFRSATLELGKRRVQLPMRAPKKIEGTPFTVQADLMLPTFNIVDGRADTEGLDLRDPAVRVTFSMNGRKASPLWLLLNEPDACFKEDSDGMLTPAPKPPFRLVGLDPVLFSGIQVASDPGYNLVLAGSLMWLFGLIALFYLHRRRLWVVVEAKGGASRVAVGGWSSRGEREFSHEFERLLDALRRRLESHNDFKITRNPLAEVSP